MSFYEDQIEDREVYTISDDQEDFKMFDNNIK